MSEPGGNFPVPIAREREPQETVRFASVTKASEKHSDRNEDQLIELPEKKVFAVLDGLGGHGQRQTLFW